MIDFCIRRNIVITGGTLVKEIRHIKTVVAGKNFLLRKDIELVLGFPFSVFISPHHKKLNRPAKPLEQAMLQDILIFAVTNNKLTIQRLTNNFINISGVVCDKKKIVFKMPVLFRIRKHLFSDLPALLKLVYRTKNLVDFIQENNRIGKGITPKLTDHKVINPTWD